jgi:signal transduction histidine kinase
VFARKAVEAVQSFRRQIDQHGFAEAEVEMVHHSGRKIPVWAKMVELKGTKEDDFQILVYLRDMEERKKVDELKDQFIGLVSHELRTPLTVIIGAVNTALSEATRLSPQETRQLLEDAASESELLSHILENLLELSRSQAGRLILHLEPLRLEDVVQKTIHEARRHSSMHQFVMDLPKKIPPLRADRIRLERILHNLVENAVKYSPGGEVRVSARQEGENLVIAVHDQGPGISLHDQARLFQPFRRTRQAETDATKGVGLGLLVCRTLAEAHGGKIWLESKPGQGTTFFFTLPVEARRRR